MALFSYLTVNKSTMSALVLCLSQTIGETFILLLPIALIISLQVPYDLQRDTIQQMAFNDLRESFGTIFKLIIRQVKLHSTYFILFPVVRTTSTAILVGDSVFVVPQREPGIMYPSAAHRREFNKLKNFPTRVNWVTTRSVL